MKKGSGWAWLHARIVVINIAVVVMFITMNQALPTPAVFRPFVPTSSTQLIKSGIPTRIVISSLGIDLSIGVGSFDSGTGDWTIDDARAYYADISVPANNRNGTTLIYGHNQGQVFGSVSSIKSSAEAIIYTNTGYQFHYNYLSMRQVLPDDTSVWQENGKPNLVLLTCSGGWDTYRSLYNFKLESVGRS